MKKKSADFVNVAELKARLSHYLRMVRQGQPITVLDRKTPIARLTPATGSGEKLRVRKATRDPKTVLIPERPAGDTDSLAILLADRQSR